MWNSHDLIRDAFIDVAVKDHLISSFVLSNKEDCMKLAEMFDYSSVQNKIKSTIRLIDGRVDCSKVDNKLLAMRTMIANFQSRSPEFQNAVIDKLGTLKTLRNEYLSSLDNGAAFSTYIVSCCSQPENLHSNVAALGLALNRTDQQRKHLMEALNFMQDSMEQQDQQKQMSEDFNSTCKLLMPRYYTIEGKNIVQAER